MRTWAPQSPGGFLNAGAPVNSVVNPSFMPASSGMQTEAESGLTSWAKAPYRWVMGKFGGGQRNNPGEIDLSKGAGMFGNSEYADYLNGMDDNGFDIAVKGKDPVHIDREAVEFLKKGVAPQYDAGFGQRKAVERNMEDFMKSRGDMSAVGGYRGTFRNVQTGLNNLAMRADALLQSKDPAERAEGEKLMNIVSRGQYVYNQTVEQTNRRLADTVNQKKAQFGNYLNNNWWWMLPAGGLLLGGLATLANRGGRQAPQEQLPDQWRTGIGRNSGNVMYQGRQNPMFENAFAFNAPNVRSNLNQNPMNVNFQNPGIAPVQQPTTPWNEQSQGDFA